MNLLLKNFKTKMCLLSLLIILSIFTNAFYNFYAILKRPYNERLMWNYGFGCEKNSYGFIQKILNKDSKLKSIYYVNFKNLPNSFYLFDDIQIDKSKKNLVLLNFKDKDEKKLKRYKINLNEYVLIEKSDSCYFYKKR